MRATLAVSPGISRHVSCVTWDQPGTLDRIADEVERAQLRLQHRRTLEHVRQDVLAFEGTAHETLPVYLGQLCAHAPCCLLLVCHDGVSRHTNPFSAPYLRWPPSPATS